MGILDLKYEAFGLDINDLSLKIVKLEKKQGGFVVSSLNEAKIPHGIIEGGMINDEDALAKIIKYAVATVKGKKLRTKYVVASLPEEKSFLQVIQMPKMTNEELKLAVPFEAENYIPLPIDGVYLDFQDISPIKDYFSHLEVLIVAMPKKIVDSYISCFKKAGIVPIALEVESEATARALVKKDNKSSLLILIDFGENNTNLVVYSGSSIRFTSSIPISSRILTESIGKTLKINFHEAENLKIKYGLSGLNSKAGFKEYSFSKKMSAGKISQIIAPILEDLAKQIKKYLNFYADHSSFEYLLAGKQDEKILICGGGSQLKGLSDFLSERIGIPVEVGDPLINLLGREKKRFADKDIISFTTAIGLELRQTDNNL